MRTFWVMTVKYRPRNLHRKEISCKQHVQTSVPRTSYNILSTFYTFTHRPCRPLFKLPTISSHIQPQVEKLSCERSCNVNVWWQIYSTLCTCCSDAGLMNEVLKNLSTNLDGDDAPPFKNKVAPFQVLVGGTAELNVHLLNELKSTHT